ncbi:MAG: valine--tRNA ligase [Candidatus Omnitrophica bacterium]|nr:valine--tRNA ligase [Candidatus Omnitrophota bacterium]
MEKKYNFTNREKIWLKFWEKEKIYKFNPKKRGKFFSIDTPPPTISGKMHIGHAFSYTHQDIIARYHRMIGENVFYPFGTDDNGLPTEKLVEKENKVNIFEMKRADFVKLCQKTLKRVRPSFVQDWKNIGMSCDFALDYSTISKKVQKISQEFFIELYRKNRVYRKKIPVLWCPECQTAIAQAELEDRELESLFVDINFELEKGKKIIIATTRPELLASCVAIFAHPKDKRYKNLTGKKAIVPIFGQKVPILTDEKVNPEKGTGLVMCCTFGDITDIEWYFTHQLPLKISLNPDGTMNEVAGKYKGLNIKEAREKIIEELEKERKLIQKRKIHHMVNVHERCGREIEILVSWQWFIKYLDLKEELIKINKKIKWFPEHMQKRYENWVYGLKWDWCISRQRYFGIPFPVWYCQKCGKIKIADISQLPINPLTTKPKTPCSCQSKEFLPEKDVLDTWATSSLTPFIATELLKDKEIKKRLFPFSLRAQAHDIINFWLFYTIVRSKFHFNKIPWKTVMISGFVLDPKGEKMSKSKGNVVSPQEIISRYGADALRHWAAKASLGMDLRWNEKEIKGSKRTIVKLWNAARFCLLHLKGFKKERIDSRELEDEDKWILHYLQETVKNYHTNFKNYEFKRARESIDNFFWKYFCDNYLEIVKPRLCYNIFSKTAKKSARFTLYTCLFSILKLYAPFIPFITEEIYQKYFRTYEKKKSIHQTSLPVSENRFLNQKTKEQFDEIIKIISDVRRYRSKRKIPFKKTIEKLIIQNNNKKIEKYFTLLKLLLNVKSIKIQKNRSKVENSPDILIFQ